jgi:hypothetical protein
VSRTASASIGYVVGVPLQIFHQRRVILAGELWCGTSRARLSNPDPFEIALQALEKGLLLARKATADSVAVVVDEYAHLLFS